MALSQVRDLLGHSSIVTTERYDNQTFEALQAAAAKLERGHTVTIPSQTEEVVAADENEAGDKDLSDSELVGGPPGDRTQDTVIKSHVLYH